ncbi:uncharacterized protein LOC127576594 [Pristis pectinata]|uniref:uncharacterized protein LOC127576594 n=1 Tax=Pristis pectinata TaxID=685728 RepID=UPI00223D233E|nr:uncharacterized protein LOC127576594 [Pristis pectinata]
MTTFICGCIRLCVEPKYMGTKCHYLPRFYLSRLLRRMGLAPWPHGVPVSWTLPRYLSFLEKFFRTNSLDHKSIRKWSAQNILQTLQEKDSIDTLGWFPEQTVQTIWQNASSPELTNKHQDLAWLAVRGALSQIHPAWLGHHPQRALPPGGLHRGRDGRPPLCGLWVCEEGVAKDAGVLVTFHPQQQRNGGFSDLRAVPGDTHRDGHQLLLEGHQLGERRPLVCPKIVGLPAL